MLEGRENVFFLNLQVMTRDDTNDMFVIYINIDP